MLFFKLVNAAAASKLFTVKTNDSSNHLRAFRDVPNVLSDDETGSASSYFDSFYNSYGAKLIRTIKNFERFQFGMM